MKKIKIGAHYFIKRNCLTCNAEFNARIDGIKKGYGKFCSRNCMGKSYWQKGHETWNKGKKGTHFSRKTEFKATGWAFQGTQLEYVALHYKIRKLLGTPETCENCLQTGLKGKKIHWANVSGKYLLDKNDWKRLCARCHFYFDGQHKRLLGQSK